ncbi:NADPH:quinone oxidoreductase family protein [Roseicella aerolata]|uniref:NADPH:quinone oxidoreductase family protein n=2 Tax=Roseicella aerolata TaxID=2883479 RepID=A0A9X1L8G7_9PROT|nr:NADPH:quinone oxidoreductase family protein [Roseicella aerolata]MCB4820270.1 NADPH:quinone oxidoreductase family protein [Roseicella aerolata]
MPRPAQGQALVRVEACGVNFADVLMVQGKYQARPPFPFAPGGEICGVVEELGPGTTGPAPGTRVLGMCGHGGFAEQALAPAEALVPVPEGVAPAAAAALSYAYGTTLHALRDRAALKPGETLLVLGAGGGAGLAAVQIGKIMGARVIAAASGDKLAACRAAGADAQVDYRQASWRDQVKALAPEGVDVAYDPVGGPYAEPALRSMAWGGRYLVIGFAAGEIPRVPLNLTLLKGCGILGVFYGAFAKREPAANAALVGQLLDWVRAGQLRPHISATYRLDDAPAALTALASRAATGKLVVLMTG